MAGVLLQRGWERSGARSAQTADSSGSNDTGLLLFREV